MAVRRAHYYKIGLINRVDGEILSDHYKNLIDNALELYLDGNNYFSIVLNNGELQDGQIIDRVTLDIISNDEQYLFARLSKSKDNKENLIRNMETNEIEELLDQDEIGIKTLETYTYLLLDYTLGVLSYIEGQQAASIHEIKKLFTENDQFEIDIQNIASTETVRALLSEGSTVARICYDFRVPTPEVLNGLGLPPRVIDVFGDTAITNARLILKNEPRRDIARGVELVSRLINSIRPVNETEPKATLIGKTPGTTQQEYGFELKNYSTPIDIPATRIEDGEIIVLNVHELSEEYFVRMRAAYIASIDTIRNLANI